MATDAVIRAEDDTTTIPSMGRHLRERTGEEQRVTFVELFFDLVYVFAVTQLSHLLIGHLNGAGAAKTGFLLIVVWWAWIYTTWMANWFEPAVVPVRLVLIGCMLASLLMAAALPDAFTNTGLLFGCAYTALQVGRNAAGTLLLHRAHTLRRDFQRMLVWSVLSGALWLAGGFAHRSARPWLWAGALAIDVVAPLVLYWVPRLGRTRTQDLPVDGSHFAERFQLFVMIALGESIVVTGATATSAGLSSRTVLALVVAFVSTAALWWLYFEEVAVNSARVMAEHEDPGRLARDAFSYMHIPIVAGIIVSAVSADALILHPGHEPSSAQVAVLLGGPLLYLLGETMFRWRLAQKVSLPRIASMLILGALSALAGSVTILAGAAIVAALLLGLAALEFRLKPSIQ
jgi:low temperature requirement protein LtrA